MLLVLLLRLLVLALLTAIIQRPEAEIAIE